MEKKGSRPPSPPGVEMLRGSHRDAFQRRMEAQYASDWKSSLTEMARSSVVQAGSAGLLQGDDCGMQLPYRRHLSRASIVLEIFKGHAKNLRGQGLGKFATVL